MHNCKAMSPNMITYVSDLERSKLELTWFHDNQWYYEVLHDNEK